MNGPVITLLSDFGLEDHYVAAMKGVILTICPGARPIDITHLIAPQDVRSAAFVLYSTHGYFPQGTIHLAVVDPGVGTERRPVAIRMGSSYFVGPDNGLFSLILKRETGWEARELDNVSFWRNPVSNTFHGRDIFAPVAAHLAAGAPFEMVGGVCGLVSAPWGEPEVGKDSVKGEVIHLDRFGNAITNVLLEVLEKKAQAKKWEVLAGKGAVSIQRSYAMVPTGEALALAGSTGFIEIAVNGGSAASKLELRPGSEVAFRLFATRESEVYSQG
ncbi:MAG: SAM-dependent chlorinase/fluorinase [Syntrophobacteraceae bacterium]|nr:SAM-dependent chlorinase/fluorinase [Syntrophobacteraceae bacterium]